jgi:hypothetical protein
MARKKKIPEAVEPEEAMDPAMEPEDEEATETPEGVEDHDWVLLKLKEAQTADHDMREQAREAANFINLRGGQWEQYWWDNTDGKPRYSFDLVTPIIDQVQRTMDVSDFSIEVLPAGGKASKDTAALYDGLVRNIENISNASETFNKSGRSMVVKGLDGWEVCQRYVDSNSFDQDLVIEQIPNFLDSVWFGPHTKQDASDASYAWRLVYLTPEDFKQRYPDRSESGSLNSDRSMTTYFYRENMVLVGKFYYLKSETRELIMMSDGKVYEDDEEFDKVEDDLKAQGITEVRRRERTKQCVYCRMFDVNGWISEAKETVFENWIPLVPIYGNFDVVEDGKVIWYGAVEKLMDPQRCYNYSLSREIEETSLAPRAKYWMTPEQAAGHEKALASLNTNSDPIQFFNVDQELPGPPQQQGGAQVNPGLARISEAMQNLVNISAGQFAAAMGDNPGLQSGKAIGLLQDRSDAGSNKYVQARTVAQRHTGRIIVNAIPRVYLPERQVRILQEDGSFEMEILGQVVIDQQAMRPVVLNDLSEGQYDVSCNVGPSYKSRQSQTVTAMAEVGALDPTIVDLGGDILLNNIPGPGMSQLAERKRAMLLKAGAIPFEQMTDEEKAQAQQQAQQPQPDPNMVLAQAEQMKSEAMMVDAQTKQAQVQISAQDSQTKQQMAAVDAQSKDKELQIRAFEAETDRYKADIDKAKALAEIKGKSAQAAKLLAEAEAIDIENDAKHSGMSNIIERMRKQMASEGGMGDMMGG